MSVFFDIVAGVLAWIYALWNNYAWAITGLTLVIMIPMTPLTLKGTRSMMVMQRLQPEMKRIQTQYKDDRQRQNEELLKFYKENNVSPLGGCLPLIVQMPVFIVLYAVLRGLTRRVSLMGFNVGFASGQLGTGAHTTKPPVPTLPQNSYFDPSYLRHDTTLYQNLSHSNTMNALGMDLSVSASKAIGSGVGHALPYIILIAIVGLTGWIQQKQIQGRTPASSVPQQQQAIMKIMPFFLPVISIGLPAGLVLYFAVSNMYRVGQQWFIGRSLYSDDATGAAGPGKAIAGSPSGPKGPKSDGGSVAEAKPAGFMARLAAASQRDDPAEAKPASKANTSGSKAGGSRATNGSASKSSASAKKAPAKAPAKSPAKKAPAKSSTTKSGSSARGSSSTKANGATTDNAKPTQPVPQPRARKNKKG